jgi:hypothetical protein
MKALDEFKLIVEEDKKADYSKFDALIRAGLANKAQMTRIHKILDRMGEEKPNFTQADRAIIQNMFVKMVDLLSHNKTINTQARKAIHERRETVQYTSDYKISPSGRKVRRSRLKFADLVDVDDLYKDKDKDTEGKKEVKESVSLSKEPPPVLLLKRKAIRMYPDDTRIALYYSQKLDRHFSIPYGPNIGENPIQAEGNVMHLEDGNVVELTEEMTHLISETYDSLSDDNKNKFLEKLVESIESFGKVYEFCQQYN